MPTYCMCTCLALPGVWILLGTSGGAVSVCGRVHLLAVHVLLPDVFLVCSWCLALGGVGLGVGRRLQGGQWAC
jgi:hypothetical protein